MGATAITFGMAALQHDRGVLVRFTDNGLFAWIIIGLLAGWIAGTISRGRGFGCIVDIILGLVGAVVGGWIFERLGITTFGFWGSLAAATVGAVVLVAFARLFAGGRAE
ncbi:MAG: GlsB/YeaQ/YmgE family stress response membrane protein [Candidatus Acidiferrales bacterium]